MSRAPSQFTDLFGCETPHTFDSMPRYLPNPAALSCQEIMAQRNAFLTQVGLSLRSAPRPAVRTRCEFAAAAPMTVFDSNGWHAKVTTWKTAPFRAQTRLCNFLNSWFAPLLSELIRNRFRCKLSSRFNVKFFVDMRQVNLHRTSRDKHTLCDLGI